MTANAANAHVTFLFKMSNSVVSGDDSVKEGTQLTLTEESCINKESEKQPRFRFDHFLSSEIAAVCRLEGKINRWG